MPALCVICEVRPLGDVALVEESDGAGRLLTPHISRASAMRQADAGWQLGAAARAAKCTGHPPTCALKKYRFRGPCTAIGLSCARGGALFRVPCTCTAAMPLELKFAAAASTSGPPSFRWMRRRFYSSVPAPPRSLHSRRSRLCSHMQLPAPRHFTQCMPVRHPHKQPCLLRCHLREQAMAT